MSLVGRSCLQSECPEPEPRWSCRPVFCRRTGLSDIDLERMCIFGQDSQTRKACLAICAEAEIVVCQEIPDTLCRKIARFS